MSERRFLPLRYVNAQVAPWRALCTRARHSSRVGEGARARNGRDLECSGKRCLGVAGEKKTPMFRPLAKLSFAIVCVAVLPAAAHAETCTVTFGFAGDARVSGAVVDVNYARSGD